MSIDPGFDLSPDGMIGPYGVPPGSGEIGAKPLVIRGSRAPLGPRGPRGARGPSPRTTPRGIRGPKPLAPILRGKNYKPTGALGPTSKSGKVPVAKGREIDIMKKPAAKGGGGNLFTNAGKSIAAAGKFPNAGGAAAGTSAGPSAGGFDLQGILNQLGLGGGQLKSLLGAMGGQPISLADKYGNPTQIGQLINSQNTPWDLSQADTMANHEFAPLIAATQAQQKIQTAQAAQNMNDIQNWYAQVVGAANQAIAGDAAISAGAAQSDKNIAADLAGSIGGSANPASANVAAAGANNAAFSNAITSSQAQYDNQIPGLLKADQSATAMREQGLQQQQALALATQLASQQGQEAQAADQLRMQMQQQNQQMAGQKLQELLGIKQYNSGLASSKAQSTLNTKLALAQMAEAAPSLGLKAEASQAAIAKTYAGIKNMQFNQKLALAKLMASGTMDNAKLQRMGFQNARDRAYIMNLAKSPQGKHLSFDTAKIGLNVGNQVGAKLGPNNTFSLPKGWNIQQLTSLISDQLLGRNYTGPQARRTAYDILSLFRGPNGKPLRPSPGWFARLK